MSGINEQNQTRHAIEMFTVANEYCLFVEKSADYKPAEILDFIHKISALLYLKGLVLPMVEPEDTDASERYVTEEQYEDILNILRAKFGTEDEFFFMDYDVAVEQNPVKGSLAEQCTDIYQDLKDFVLLYSKNSALAKENAIADVKMLFNNHWGPRILTIQQILHARLYSISPDENDQDF
jgi:hypothetical protein